MTVQERLGRLGLSIPAAPQPAGRYRATIKAHGLLFVSGQFPIEDGALKFKGRVGLELTEEEGCKAARLAALNVLAQLEETTDGFASLEQIARLEGHVASAPCFTRQPAILDCASDLFAEALGERAGHARTAFSHSQLPLDAPVELVVIAALRDAGAAP
jgi:enamine deaminase RidA (YjgF/YER057c/UK114 family)